MTIQRHNLPCGACGSSDAVTDYGDHTYCFSCSDYKSSNNNHSQHIKDKKHMSSPNQMDIQNWVNYNDIEQYGVFEERRGITKNVMEKFGVRITYKGDREFTCFPYYDVDGNLVAYKTRDPNKKMLIVYNPNFKGQWNNTLLFGQNLFEKDGKAITLVEGEFDALAAYQMNGERYPVVSVKNGAKKGDGILNDVKPFIEYLSSFDKLVICFDADQPGKDSAKSLSTLFQPSKTYVMKLDATAGKDANEYLQKRLQNEFITKWFRAEKYTPEGIFCTADMWDFLHAKQDIVSVDYPFSSLNEKTYGMRLGELCTVTADTGVGKSQFLRECIYNIFNKSNYNVGMLFLEETKRFTMESLMSLHLNKQLHLPDTEYALEEYKEAFDKIHGSGRFYGFDSFGSNDIETVLNNIRYLVKGADCKFIFLDHISIIVSDQRQGDERKALDEITTKLKTLTVELGIHLCMVAHTNRQGQIRGTAGIEQLSNIILSLDRDKTSTDAVIRNTTQVTVDKNRFSGDTGIASHLFYNRATGRLVEQAISDIDPAINSFQ